MAYPLSIASLHFQYKTAFDVLKAYMPDKNDDELSQMVLDFKTKKDASKPPPKTPTKPAESVTETPTKKEPKKAPKKEAEETPSDAPPSDAPNDESAETPKKKESKTKKPKV
jgi:hypothetical protein